MTVSVAVALLLLSSVRQGGTEDARLRSDGLLAESV
jgi:hypothetical protein